MKINTAVTIMVSITLIACQRHNNSKIGYLPISKNTYSVIDSLEKYINADSLFTTKLYKFYVGRLNGLNYSFVQTSDTVTVFYQQANDNWIKQDSFPVPLNFVQATDLNGDKSKDLILTYNVTAVGGNSENICLLYYPALKRFKHNKSFDLSNISYDSSTSFIHSSWWGSSLHLQDKRLYKIQNDSLIFMKGIGYEPDEKTMGRLARVFFYTIHNNKRVVEKEMSGTSEKFFEFFHMALWNTNDEF